MALARKKKRGKTRKEDPSTKTPKQLGKMQQEPLFELGPPTAIPQTLVKVPRHPVWTENKAKLIQTYLRLFVYITYHGNYIDGFSGPQEPEKPDMWAARLVLSSKPRRLRKFFLFERDEKKVQMLRELKDEQPPPDKSKREYKRVIEIFPGDVNANIQQILNETAIGMNEATFCLLDQWTNQCDWATVQALAKYKTGNKIELFYFFANGWMDRSLAALKDRERARRWWGGDDWEKLRGMRPWDRAKLVADRFVNELGYKHATPWAIYDRQDGGNIMFFMIHATDHPEAPKLMSRAYNQAVISERHFDQAVLDFGPLFEAHQEPTMG